MKHSPIDRHAPLHALPCPTIDEIALAPLLADHADMRDVCDELESLAERLAGPAAIAERSACARRMHAAMVAHLKATSGFFYQTFSGDETQFTRRMLAHILLRQISDAVHAEDVAEALTDETAPLPLDRLGDMLRRLFEGWRRALEFEELSLLSLGRDRLTARARLALEGLLERPVVGLAAPQP